MSKTVEDHNYKFYKDPLTQEVERIDLITGETEKVKDIVSAAELKRYPYTVAQAQEILSRIVCGESVTSIAKDPTMPSYGVIMSWKIRFPDFGEMYRKAWSMRADRYVDKLEDVIETTTERDEVPAAKLKVDGYKWLAEKADPSRFGSKQEVSHTGGAVNIVVHTGINREPVTVEGEVVKDDVLDADSGPVQGRDQSDPVVEREGDCSKEDPDLQSRKDEKHIQKNSVDTVEEDVEKQQCPPLRGDIDEQGRS